MRGASGTGGLLFWTAADHSIHFHLLTRIRTMKTSRLLGLFIVAAIAVCGGILILSAAAQAPPAIKPPEDAYQQIFQEQIARTKRYEGLLGRQEELMKRQEELMKRQEDGAVRFLTIVDKWEKQQAQYQKYLDGLGKK
jgi:hypothetical protein